MPEDAGVCSTVLKWFDARPTVRGIEVMSCDDVRLDEEFYLTWEEQAVFVEFRFCFEVLLAICGGASGVLTRACAFPGVLRFCEEFRL